MKVTNWNSTNYDKTKRFDFGHSFVFPSKFDDLLVAAKLGDLALQVYAMPNFVDDMASKHAVRNSFWWSTKAER